MDLLVVAKEPVPGRVKTRLTPPCRPVEAAALAEAALVDTLAAAVASGADRVVVALDGSPGPWCPPGVTIVGQGTGDLSQRLATAWRAMTGPTLQIGMDTPHVGPAALADAMQSLAADGVEAALGLADDGGWWAIGFTRPSPHAFAGIPTSRADTGARQLERLHRLGLRTARPAVQRDVDTWDDARAAAGARPDGAFGAATRRVAARMERDAGAVAAELASAR